MSYINIWIHSVWSTKNRYPHLKKGVKGYLLDHIEENANEKGIYIRSINAMEDHVHVLFSLGATDNVAYVIQLIKGESSHWLNQQALLKTEFIWGKEYYAASVSGHNVKHIIHYIDNQHLHHQRITFEEERKHLLDKYGGSLFLG